MPTASVTLFPPIGNYLLTQIPYHADFSFDTVDEDLETGMRFAFGRRGLGLTGYPTAALGMFAINYPMITTSEVVQLLSFFNSQRGAWGKFAILDPMGNLVLNSEDFTDPSWGGSGGFSITLSYADPFGRTKGTLLSSGSSDGILSANIGPPGGSLQGFMLCASVWAMALAPNQVLFIGFKDGSGTLFGQASPVPLNAWSRISYRTVIASTNQMSIVIGGQSTWGSGQVIALFGAQVSPTKGESAYTRSPDNYGYHPNCRFNVDSFARQLGGPNQNSISLPCVEMGG